MRSIIATEYATQLAPMQDLRLFAAIPPGYPDLVGDDAATGPRSPIPSGAYPSRDFSDER
jgi:hypothetical protein